jgi:hypothetical protein
MNTVQEIVKDIVFSPPGVKVIVIDDPDNLKVLGQSILKELKEHPYLYGESFIKDVRVSRHKNHIILINSNEVCFIPAIPDRMDCYLCGEQADKVYNFSALDLEKEIWIMRSQ